MNIQSAAISLCLIIIAVVLLYPTLGWLGILGLWIFVAVNNWEQRKQIEKMIEQRNISNSLQELQSLVKLSHEINKHKPVQTEVWNTNETKPEPEEENESIK